ncbi:histone-lysine n-methyltransferase mll [Dermatophagoides farinae]|uniref:Histone-lysine n-methyltransferase mll n=1 Tax=Dermatophagoides farinae TaxID=6954 RepID=A0A9D4SCR8_DERFA|nr:histone-lysine n-methyltransferase mll [Dermatophagoides farinae]
MKTAIDSMDRNSSEKFIISRGSYFQDNKTNHHNNQSTSSLLTNINNNNKKSRCKECEGCRAQDCGQCSYCLDKKKFGGSNNILGEKIQQQSSFHNNGPNFFPTPSPSHSNGSPNSSIVPTSSSSSSSSSCSTTLVNSHCTSMTQSSSPQSLHYYLEKSNNLSKYLNPNFAMSTESISSNVNAGLYQTQMGGHHHYGSSIVEQSQHHDHQSQHQYTGSSSSYLHPEYDNNNCYF